MCCLKTILCGLRVASVGSVSSLAAVWLLAQWKALAASRAHSDISSSDEKGRCDNQVYATTPSLFQSRPVSCVASTDPARLLPPKRPLTAGRIELPASTRRPRNVRGSNRLLVEPKTDREPVTEAVGRLRSYVVRERGWHRVDEDAIEMAVAPPQFDDPHRTMADEWGFSLCERPV